MKRQQEQMDIVFEDVRNKKLKQEDIESFIRQFDNQSDQYCDQKEDQLRQPAESMNYEMVRLIDQWKQKESNRMQSNDNQQIMMVINSIKNKYEEIINKSEQIIKKQRSSYSEMMQCIGKLRYIKQLRGCENKVNISYQGQLDNQRRQIEEYQQNDKQYKIEVSFAGISKINDKMRMLRMINTLNSNSNVGKVQIVLGRYRRWNERIMRMMMDRFNNVYHIEIIDKNDQVDDSIHRLIKQWVMQQQLIIGFGILLYDGSLGNHTHGLDLIKEYNEIMKQKYYLDRLIYENYYPANTKQKVVELIMKVDNIL